jgi:hypothetical protein
MKLVMLKNMPSDYQLVGLKVHIPIASRRLHPELKPKMYIHAGYSTGNGLWLKYKTTENRVIPFAFKDFKEILKWKVEIE